MNHDTTPRPTSPAANIPAEAPPTDDLKADPAPEDEGEEEHELRCTLCGLRACWTG
jgi:hypothetical protein